MGLKGKTAHANTDRWFNEKLFVHFIWEVGR